MGFIKEFKEFAMKGNVMDMAVGVIIGGAFGKIVSSLVDDVLMPIIGKLTGGVSFVDLFVTLGDGDWSCRLRLRTVHPEHRRLPDRCLLYFPDAEGHQQDEPQEGRAQARRARSSQGSDPGRAARRDPRPAEEKISYTLLYI